MFYVLVHIVAESYISLVLNKMIPAIKWFPLVKKKQSKRLLIQFSESLNDFIVGDNDTNAKTIEKKSQNLRPVVLLINSEGVQ